MVIVQRTSAVIDVSRLRSVIRGEVIAPTDAAYDPARTLFYTGIDRRPAAIIRPADSADIASAVVLASEHGVELAIRSGGHSSAGHSVSDGGLTVDLASMKALDVDVTQRTAWAETGLTAGEYTAAVGAHGLATGFGDTASVGIGGITLGGGIGFLHRKYGLTIDNVLAAEIVTADGRLLYTDAGTHPDLFWAIRGGGGNFGVVTRFKYRLSAVHEVVGGMLILPASAAAIEAVVAEAERAPEELAGMINIAPAPPMPGVPEELYGKPIVMAMLSFAGDPDAGERAFAPFRKIGTPVVDTVKPMRYPQLFEGHEGPANPVGMKVNAFFMDRFDRSAAERVLEGLERSTAQMSVVQIRVLGGAVERVAADATAFAHRGRRLLVAAGAVFQHIDEAAVHAEWTASVAASLRHDGPGAYVGFLGDEGSARVREAYLGTTWDRLRAVKATYDPGNLFRLNQNVPPAV